MSKSKKLNVQGVAITFYENGKNDYISQILHDTKKLNIPILLYRIG